MSIGNNIKKLRELRNFTQSYLSQQLEMSLSGYSKIERDETDISVKRLEQIAEVLNTDIKTILDFNENKIFNIEQHQNANGNQSGYVSKQKNFDGNILETLVGQLKSENEFLKELLKSKT